MDQNQNPNINPSQTGGFLGISMEFIGRLLIASLFIITGIRAAMNFTAYTNALQSFGLGNAQIIAIISIIIQIFGGLLFTGILAINYSVSIGKILLIIYLLASIYYNVSTLNNPAQVENLLKNIAILGGIILA